MKHNFDNYRFRCSALGKIMAGAGPQITQKQLEEIAKRDKQAADFAAGVPKVKDLTDIQKAEIVRLKALRDSEPELTAGVKTYLRELWIEEVHNRRKEIRSKYLAKGLAVEEDAITLVSEVDGTIYYKNEEHLSNEFITGTPDWPVDNIDLHEATILDDGKCSWDIFTYYKSKDAPLDTDYEWQLNGYMYLLPNLVEARLRYCLIDTPDALLEKEKNNLKYEMGVIDPDGPGIDSQAYREACEEIDRLGKYGDIPAEDRVHTRVVKRDLAKIEMIGPQVQLCRAYMNTLS